MTKKKARLEIIEGNNDGRSTHWFVDGEAQCSPKRIRRDWVHDKRCAEDCRDKFVMSLEERKKLFSVPPLTK